MFQWNKGFGRVPSMRLHMASDLGIAALVLMFLTEPPVDLGSRVPLFGRGRLVVFEYLLNQRQKRPKLRSISDAFLRNWIRLRLAKDFSNRIA